jgi:ABC-type branched-subunit amino acid transport system substrate-binding protein
MRLSRWLLPFVVVALATSGCSRSSGSGKGGGSSSSTGAATAALGDFGSLKGVCGPGSAKGATAQGVTDTTIRVGTMADPGTTVLPGLDQELFDSADAFVGWCNDAGGILGRKLQLDKWDSKLTEVAPRMIQACDADFTLVGNGEALDQGGVAQRVKCQLPEFSGYNVSPQAAAAPMSIEAIPNPNNASLANGAMRALKAADPEAVKHFGLLSSQFESIKQQGDKDRAAAENTGYSTVYYDELPLSVDNWRPYAQNMQTKGVQVLTAESAPEFIAALYKQMQQLGYTPKYGIAQANLYTPNFIANAGPALQNTTVLINTSIVPFELADSHPATKQYIGLLNKYVNGAKPKALGVNGFSSWLLWAQSVKACGSNLTRDCILAEASKVTIWDGAGLHAPDHPGNSSAPAGQCFVLIQATPTAFVVDKKITNPNNDIFNCSPDNNPKLSGFPK